jgi:hypothetical protein
MRKSCVLVLLLFVFNYVALYAQPVSTAPEILILGTVHKNNKKITHHTLFDILNKYQPDLILKETENDYEYVFGLFTAYRLKIASPSMEQLALQKFKRHNKTVPVLGFDITITSRKNYLKNLIKLYDRFHEALYATKKNPSDSILYANYTKLSNEYFDQYMFETISYINQDSVFSKARLVHQMEDDIVKLGSNYISDKKIVDAYKADNDFWITRNEYMGNKIVEITKQRNPKRIVVITGLSHKYYLLDKLKNQAEVPFRFLTLTD